MAKKMFSGGDGLRLAISLVLPLAVGGMGGWATSQGVRDWYPTLLKPPFNPPSWVFGPTWTLLYLMMGMALFLVWRRGWGEERVKGAILAFGVQLSLNFIWSFLFFWARSPGWALVEILLLLAAILWTTSRFFKVSRVAGFLMTPYIGWVTFATLLNASIWYLNR